MISVRRKPMASPILFMAIAAAFAMPNEAGASGPLTVDVVTLKSGRTLRGAVLHRQADGTLLVAVSREWLEKTDAKGFALEEQRQAGQQREAWTQTKERIEAMLADPPDAARFVFFLKQELQRIAKELAAPTPKTPPFFLMEIPARHAARVVTAPPDRQRLALFAWQEGLSDVETRSATELRQELVAAGVDVDGPVPDLSDRLPVRPQSESEWSARLAIVEYTLHEALDFQGMGQTLIRTGEGKAVNPAALLPLLLNSQADSLLGDLFEPIRKPGKKPSHPDAFRPAIRIAEKNQRRGFRVTRLDLDAERMAVVVETEFVARLNDGTWQTIWRHAELADGSKARPEVEAKIAQDPQVKTLLETLQGLGLGADESVTQALRVGAATMAAQQAGDARFFEFRDRYSRRLDGPALFVGSP